MSRPFLTTKQLAMVPVFAALQAVLGTLPFTITIGVSGLITLGVIGGPLIGILLGPLLGGLSVLIGSLIGVFVNPAGAIFGVFTVLPPTLGAVGAGFTMQKKGYIAGAIILFSLLAFYAHPFGRESFLYPWLHIIAMIIAFASSLVFRIWKFNSFSIQRIWIVPIAAFVGTLTDHIFGSGFGIWYFNPHLTPQIWNFIMFVYPVERIVAAILTSAVGIPLLYSLQRAGLLEFSKKSVR